MHRRLIAAVLCVATAATPAAADDVAEADRLFREGRTLLDAGRAAEACPYFEQSQELDPGRGTLINLAACYEAVGRLVAALGLYRDVVAQSRAAGDQPRLDAAGKRIAALEARIPHLAITVAGEAPAGLVIAVQGGEIAAASWPDVLVDPGEVRVRASAPGYQPYEITVKTVADGKRTAVEIPGLAPASSGEPAPVTVTRRKDRTRVIAGIATMGAGALALGGASVLALGARRDYNDALDTHCGGATDGCSMEGLELTRDARRRGNLATLVGGVGLAAVAAGVILWVTAPTEEIQVVPQVGGDGGGVSLVGWF